MEEKGILSGADGLVTNIADPLRPQTALKVANNFNHYPQGVITNGICGWTRQRQATFNSGAEAFGFSNFVDKTGVNYLLMQWGSKLYKYDLPTATETQILTGLSLTTALSKKALPCMRMYVPYAASAPYMVYVNGVDAPKKLTCVAGTFSSATLQLNGANFGTVALSAALAGKTLSNPRFAEPFLDRMVYAGFTGDATFDVGFSNSGDAEAMTVSSPIAETDAGLFQVDPQLGLITALKSFKLSNSDNTQVLLIGQERGVSIVTGKGASTFECYTLTDEYGIPSNRTWIQIGSNLWFLGSDGVRQFSSLVENANLIASSLTYAVQDLSDRFNESQLYKAHAVHHKKYMEVQFWFPVDADDQPQNAFVMSYLGSDSKSLQAAIFTKDGTNCLASTYFDKTFYGGTSDGVLQKWHTGSLYDTVPAISDMTFANIRPDDAETECSLEKIIFVTYGSGQKFIANASRLARVYSSGGAKIGVERKDGKPVDYLIDSLVEIGTVLGDWVLGSSAIPSEHMRIHEFRPQGSGLNWDVSVRCNESDHRLDFMAAPYRINSGARNA